MAFKPAKSDVASTVPLTSIPAKMGEIYRLGQLLCVVGGEAVKCGASAKPMYCSNETKTAGEDDLISCYRIPNTMEFETELSQEGAALHIGDKVTLSADGLGVTATTAGGVAEIVKFFGTAVGSKIHVRF